MEPRKLSPITIGIAGAAGTGGIGIVVSRLPTGQGGVTVTCLVLAMSFTVTSLTAALGLILNYRFGKLALRVQASALQCSADLRITRLELQRVILDKIQDGTKAAHAYREMTAVDALSCSNLATGGSCDPNQLLRKLIQAGADNDHFDAWAGGKHAGLPHCLQATHCQPNPLGLKFPTYASVGRVLCRLSLVLSRSSSSGLSSSSAGCYGMNSSDSAKPADQRGVPCTPYWLIAVLNSTASSVDSRIEQPHPSALPRNAMIHLSQDERAQVRSQQCFFRATSDIPGYGRFYSADARFPCSVAVPGMPRFVYHRWDEQYLGVTFNIRGEEDAAVFRTNLNDFADDREDEVDYARRFERDSYAAGASSKARIRPRIGRVAAFTAHRVDYDNGWQRVFFVDSGRIMWNIHNRGIGDQAYGRIISSFRFLQQSYFREITGL